MATDRVFLVEMDGWNPTSSAVETLYWTDGAGFQTEEGDDPSDEFYEPYLVVPPGRLYKRSLFADGRTGGGTQVEIADGIAIANTGGQWDHLAEWGWDGRPFRLYKLDAGQGRADAVLLLSGVVEQLLPVYEAKAGEVDSRLVIRLKDPLSRFDQPLQPYKYLGTNVGPDGFEGTEEDLKGQPRPIGYGVCREVPARPVNTSLLVYQVADGAVAEISSVYDKGVMLTLDTDYATPALLAAATPGLGEYATCLAYGLFMLGATPAGAITADISTVGSPLPSGNAVELDGAGGNYHRAGAVSGAAATDRGLASLWFRVDDGDGFARTLVSLRDANFQHAFALYLDSANRLVAEWLNAAGGSNGNVISTATYPAGGGWHHLVLAWIFGPVPYIALRVDGGNQTNAGVDANGLFAPLGTGCRIGAQGAVLPSQPFPGALAEVWIGWGQFLDITVSAGVERFRTLSGYPADLGPTGARPTGTSATIYLRGGPDVFGSNLGTGGDFVREDTAALATSTPYAPPPASPSLVTAAEIIRDIARARAGVTEDEIDGPAFDQAMLDAPEPIGLWVGEERTVRDVLDEVANSAALAYWWRSDGKLTLARFRAPTGPPVATIQMSDTLSLARQPVTDTGNGLPAYSVVVEHSPIYQVQDGGALADSVDTARRAYLATEFRRAAPTADNSVRVRHLLAPELTWQTRISEPSAADAFAADRLALYSRRRARWLDRVPLNDAMAALEPFDVVELRDDRPGPRFGLGGGKLFRVLGIDPAWRDRTIEFDLWGGVAELRGDDPIQGWAFPAGRVGGLRGAGFAGWSFAIGRVGNITGSPIVGWTFPAGTVQPADLLTTEAGDPLVTEAGDNLIVEE